jgi:hypothetical protein
MEGIDKPYFHRLCRWIANEQKEITQPKRFYVDDISFNHGPVKLLEHIRLYIDTMGAADVEISSDYSELKVYL